MTTALSHLRYLVSDFTPVLHFYRDVLRLKLAVDVPGVYAEFETPGGRLAFYRADLMAEVIGAPVATHIGDDCVMCLRVENVDAAAARVKLAIGEPRGAVDDGELIRVDRRSARQKDQRRQCRKIGRVLGKMRRAVAVTR